MIDIKPVTLAVRFFDGQASYGEPYKAVATVQITPDVAYISSMHGDICREDYEQLLEAMKDYGVSEVHWHRIRSTGEEPRSKLVRRSIQTAVFDEIIAGKDLSDDAQDDDKVVPIGVKATTEGRF